MSNLWDEFWKVREINPAKRRYFQSVAKLVDNISSGRLLRSSHSSHDDFESGGDPDTDGDSSYYSDSGSSFDWSDAGDH